MVYPLTLEETMATESEKKHRERLKKLKKQRESIKKAAKRGKVVSKKSKGKFIIPKTKDGRPIPTRQPRPQAEPSKTAEE